MDGGFLHVGVPLLTATIFFPSICSLVVLFYPFRYFLLPATADSGLKNREFLLLASSIKIRSFPANVRTFLSPEWYIYVHCTCWRNVSEERSLFTSKKGADPRIRLGLESGWSIVSERVRSRSPFWNYHRPPTRTSVYAIRALFRIILITHSPPSFSIALSPLLPPPRTPPPGHHCTYHKAAIPSSSVDGP